MIKALLLKGNFVAKRIIMKILSIATVGGQHVKCFLGCLVIIMSVISCDTGYILPLANNKFSYDVSLSEGSMVKVSSMYFKGWYYLLFDLKGEYVINPDSLKLKFCDESIMVGKLLPYSGTDTYNKNNTYVKNRLIAVQLHYKPKAVALMYCSHL